MLKTHCRSNLPHIHSPRAALRLQHLSTLLPVHSRPSPLISQNHNHIHTMPSLQPINLQLGWPSKSLFPTTQLANAANKTLLTPSLASEALVYGPDPGHKPLRESLSVWLTKFYAPAAGPVNWQQIFIGNGASMALGIILAKFTDPLYTRRVFMVEPTYFLACPIMEDAGFEGLLRGVPEDEEGIDLGFLRGRLEEVEMMEGVGGSDGVGEMKRDGVRSQAKYPKLYRYVIYAVPTFANPSGKVMSLRRRRELVLLAREFDALVVTDDVYDMLRWPVDPSVDVKDLPPPPPRLCDVDREMPGQTRWGNAVSNGSFSKIVGPGTRVSWIEGTPDFITAVSTHGATKSGGSPGHMASVFMDQMLRVGDVEKHINEVLVPTYRKRYAVLMEMIEKELIPLGVRMTAGQAYGHDDAESEQARIAETGGFFIYLDLPDDVQPSSELSKVALDSYNLKFAHGSMMVAAGDPSCLERAETSFGKGIRLSWSWHDEHEIREGIERLAQVIRDKRAGTIRAQAQAQDEDVAEVFNRN